MHKLAVSPELLVTGHAGEFLSRQWGQHSPAKAPTTILSLRHSIQDLSVERAIDVNDPMGAVSTVHARTTHDADAHSALKRFARGLECTQHSVHSKS